MVRRWAEGLKQQPRLQHKGLNRPRQALSTGSTFETRTDGPPQTAGNTRNTGDPGTRVVANSI
jgi:hypothetical protein